jgi:hypothetical protein
LRSLPLLALLAACSQSIAPGGTLEVSTPSDGDPTVTGGDDDDAPPANQPPIADAGEDFEAYVTDEVDLDGSGSYDPDGDAIEFEWTLLDRPADSNAELLNDTRPNPSFFADRPGVYLIEVAVNDALSVSTDEVQVLVAAANEGPVANAGPDQTVGVGDRVVLNGSGSYDPDGDPLEFTWTLTATPSGSSAALDSTTTALPQFTADQAGVYVIELTVSDGVDRSPTDQVVITASEATDTGCFSCAMAEQELHRRVQTGHFASAGLLASLILLRRRR